jgi:hypothetical protein
MTIPTPDSVYEQVWKGIVEKDGAPDFQKVKELLFDYGALLEGQIDDPQEPVEDVIDLADHLAAESIDLGIRSVLSHLLEELDRTSANSPEERLQTLTATINSIYEQGAPDAE